eukprot:Platyproteum_vivax@DN3841_c0_g1_i1.p1
MGNQWLMDLLDLFDIEIGSCLAIITFFVYVDPTDMDNRFVDYDAAVKEAKKDELGQLTSAEAEEEMQTRMAELQAKMEKEKQEAADKMRKQQEELEAQKKKWEEEFEAKMASGGKEGSGLAKEREAMEKQLQEQQRMLDEKAKQLKELEEEQQGGKQQAAEEMRARLVLEEILARTIMLVDEANCISDELNKGVMFSIKLVTKSDAFDIKTAKLTEGAAFQNTEILIKVDNWQTEHVTYWSIDVMEERMYLIRELYANWTLNEGEEPASDEKDPFEDDPNARQHIGNAYLYLDPLRSLVDVERETIPIFDHKGAKEGELLVSVLLNILAPNYLEKGNVAIEDMSPEEDFKRREDLESYDTIEELLGRALQYTVIVESVVGLPEAVCRNPEVSYKVTGSVNEYRATVPAELKDRDLPNVLVSFKYKSAHVLAIDDKTVDTLDNGVLVFEVSAMLAKERGGIAPGKGGPRANADAELKQSREEADKLKTELESKAGQLSDVEQKLKEKEDMLARLEEQLKKEGKTLLDVLG